MEKTMKLQSNKALQNNKLYVFFILGLFLFSFLPAAARAQDVDGSKDHPLISRYPGSRITDYKQEEFDQYTLPLGKLEGDAVAKKQDLEGKITRIHYEIPLGRSTLEVFRNYQSALQNAGFQTLFTCSIEQCGGGAVSGPNDYSWCGGCSPRQISAKLSRTQGDVYVSVHLEQDNSNTPVMVLLDVIEVKPMEGGLITVNAAALAGDLSRTGHAAVYGIYFDTGKADVKPESDAALKEISKLLQQDPNLKLYVVGHTDNQGMLEANMVLSMHRANAVVLALSSKFGVSLVRLKALGDGPSSPVASNDSEDGRAKNRRVELVKQ
jgi:OmpA-OmpF porin, OOP family